MYSTFKNRFESQSLIPGFVHPLYSSDLRSIWMWTPLVVTDEKKSQMFFVC